MVMQGRAIGLGGCCATALPAIAVARTAIEIGWRMRIAPAFWRWWRS
jgi:hypothetical protein